MAFEPLLESALVYSVIRARYQEVLRFLSLQFVVVVLVAAAALCVLAPLPPGTWRLAGEAREAEARVLATTMAALPVKSYFVALNLFNNEAIMEQLQDQLLLLAEVLGEDNIYVSVWENGSRDGTKAAMAELSAALTERGVRHKVVAGNSSWWDMCPLLATPELRRACDACEFVALRNCAESVRIPVMALIRNQALLPLFGVDTMEGLYARAAAAAAAAAQAGPASSGGLGRATHVARHLGFTHPTQVVFLNDVLLYARDVVELLSTQGGRYDLACAADFESMQLYDVWVARDLHGASLSGWYPYVRERAAQARLVAGQPFRVYSCWNGIVALPADALVSEGLLFRSWRPGELRSLHAETNASHIWSDACPVSECHLVCKDLWAAGRTRIYMNPRVRVVYNAESEMSGRVWLPLINGALLSWTHRLAVPHHALRSSRVLQPVGSHHAANDPPDPRREGRSAGGVAAANDDGLEGGVGPASVAAWWRSWWDADLANTERKRMGDTLPEPRAYYSSDSDGVVPPIFVACGLSDDDVLPNGFKQNITTPSSARRPPRPLLPPDDAAAAGAAWEYAAEKPG